MPNATPDLYNTRRQGPGAVGDDMAGGQHQGAPPPHALLQDTLYSVLGELQPTCRGGRERCSSFSCWSWTLLPSQSIMAREVRCRHQFCSLSTMDMGSRREAEGRGCRPGSLQPPRPRETWWGAEEGEKTTRGQSSNSARKTDTFHMRTSAGVTHSCRTCGKTATTAWTSTPELRKSSTGWQTVASPARSISPSIMR